jgi:hypothetical protein
MEAEAKPPWMGSRRVLTGILSRVGIYIGKEISIPPLMFRVPEQLSSIPRAAQLLQPTARN